MNWIKQNSGKVILSIILIGLYIWHSAIFFIVILVYGWAIYFLATKPMSRKIHLSLSVIIWAAFVIVAGLTLYGTYWLPHGPSYPTGDFVCQNDDRGPCGEQYIEDTRGLDIPSWAKFLRKSEGELLFWGLLFAGIVISGKNKNTED